MKIVFKIIKTILAVAIFTVIPVIIFLLITAHTGFLYGIRTFTVLTGSMEPTVHVGSSILTVPASQYQVGDVITFKRGALTVTHRIHSIGSNGQFIVKGDANRTQDPQPVNKMLVIGKDVLIVPYMGTFLNFVKTLPGIIIFIILPIVIYISFELLNIKKEIEKQVELRVRKQYETTQS